MPELRITKVEDERTIEDWKHAHNEIVSVAPLSTEEVRERTTRYHLEVAYLGDTLVGCSTVRPPEEGVATVIVRVLEPFRGQGLGDRLYERAVRHAETLAPQNIETIIWVPNTAGLRFAESKGFTEVERDDDWIVLRR